MKNNCIYWIKVKTPSVLDEIFNSNLISQYKKLSLIDYGTANSSVYNYHFDDDRSFWVEANGISDVLSMLSTISVEFSTPILSFHNGNFAFFNSLGKKIDLDEDVKTDFKKTCKVIEMQTGYFFDLEDEMIDIENDCENDLELENYEDDEEENDIDYQFNFSSNNNLEQENDFDSFGLNKDQESGCPCGSCGCHSNNEEIENDQETIEDEKTKEQIIKELFEIASQEEYDKNSNENQDISESELDDVFMDALKEQIQNIENQEKDKSEINDILKFFNDDESSKKSKSKIEIDEISLNEKFEPEVISFELDVDNDLDEEEFTFEDFDSTDEENEFDKLVNQASYKEDKNKEEIQFGCNQQDCQYCYGSCSCSHVFDNYDEIDDLAAEAFNFDQNKDKEYFESQVDDFSIYEYEEPCCEDKLEYYTETTDINEQSKSYNLEEEKIMEKELDKDIEGFKEIGFDDIEKALKEFFDMNNSLEYVSDPTKDDVDKILKRIETLREKNNTNNLNCESEVDLKPIYESLKNGEVTLDIYTEESQKFIIDKLNGLLADIENNKTNSKLENTNDEDINIETIESNNDENELMDNGEIIKLDEIVATDLNLETNHFISVQDFYENMVPFDLENFDSKVNDDQFKNIDDVLDSKFGGYNQEVVANLNDTKSNFENFDDVINSKFGGYETPVASYGFVSNESDSVIDSVLDQKFGFYSSNQNQENEISGSINNEINSNIDSVLDEKFGGYNNANSKSENWNTFDYDFLNKNEFNFEQDLSKNNSVEDSLIDLGPIENDFEFNEEISLPPRVVSEDNVDSFDDSINDLEFGQQENDYEINFETENLFDKFNESIGEEPLVDLSAFDKPEEITSDNIEKIGETFESSETLFDDNENPENMFDLEKENLYRNIYDDVVSNDKNLNDALKWNEDFQLSDNEISFETKPFEKDFDNKNKKETKKSNIDNLFKYDHSRIDLGRIKANSESQRAIISGLSEFLKKIEVEKSKLQQKREEIEKKNELAKQIISQGYARENSFDFEKRNWR
ncbi:hypothetical protein [Malacoplasma iowae]|uniref:Uncharacterized protein n=1 Tax=Malacoplasma iowae DK-CPA TaxID=1394179 RepID=A0A084U3D7_MALIO|nr:hypothetical protein [Malacoplasma iowae]KFB07473.1 hypothetical protein P271_311 [Malacoplasma iowae DK-CPA]WPL37166.1 hypothetical protein QX179_01650 [Malacoplasma iowae]WPL40723.1 hypothetical protein QX184_04280 [Malacoplasma iowae]